MGGGILVRSLMYSIVQKGQKRKPRISQWRLLEQLRSPDQWLGYTGIVKWQKFVLELTVSHKKRELAV